MQSTDLVPTHCKMSTYHMEEDCGESLESYGIDFFFFLK